MRQLMMGVVAGLLLPLSPAQANIQTDLTSGLSLTEVIQNAMTDANSVDDILAELLVECQPQDDFITCKEGSAEAIISAAASAYAEDPEALQSIGQTALDTGLTEAQLTQIALNNNIDPTALLPATAAGNPANPQQGLTATPGATTNTPATFGTNTGGGGGGNASPSA
ncbi:hypothetical protein [Amphritea sp.]|uniref:hypothetical protein n=1 Tax=Amphritea sp. TaxID=1872502 RepID=UPI003A90DE2A